MPMSSASVHFTAAPRANITSALFSLEGRFSNRSRRVISDVGFAELNGAALLYVIPRIHRKFHDDVALDDCLTAQPRVGPEVPRRIKAVEFLVLRFAEVLLALANVEMTGRARAASTARMLEGDSEIHRHVEERLRQTVVLVRELAFLELDGRFRAVLDESDLGHQTSFTFLPASASRTV